MKRRLAAAFLCLAGAFSAISRPAYAQWDWFEGILKPFSTPSAPPSGHAGAEQTVPPPAKKTRHERPHSQEASSSRKKKIQSKQEKTKAAREAHLPAKPQEPSERPHAPYEKDLLRLAEILGTLTYLETLCGKQTENWNARMAALMEAEATTEDEKERMAGAYNRGLRDYQLSYRVCTPNAQTIITRFFAEGAKISNGLIDRYGTY